MRESIVVLAGLMLAIACAPGEDAPRAGDTPAGDTPFIEFRLVRDAVGDGSRTGVLDGETMHLAGEAVIADGEIRAVVPAVRAGRLLLDMQLTDAGAQRLHAITSDNVGRRMALLVDGRIRSAPVIASPIGGEPRFQVAIEVLDAEALELAERIRARWPASDR